MNLVRYAICSLLVVTSAFTQQDSLPSKSDTLTASPLVIIPASPSSENVKKGFQPSKSSLLAIALSAVAPGAGQIYNEDYWKLPIIWGLGGYWTYELLRNDKLYRENSDKYQNSISPLLRDGDLRLLQLRDFYRDARDEFAWYLGVLYALNILDAYVGANLYDFDVSPDLSQNGKIVPKVTATIKVKL
jgi:hypothetical protein